MTRQIDACLEKLGKLQILYDRANWGESTKFRPPCKPLLILSVIDMAANGSLQENFIEPSFELAATYNRYWEALDPALPAGNLAATFLALEEDGFWEMTGQEAAIERPITTMTKLRANYHGARMPTDIFPLLTREISRKKLRETLITTYFAPDIQASLLDVALINHAAVIYSKGLLSGKPVPGIKTGRGEKINRRISSLGFNSAVLELYDHRCAICGLKLLTPEGHSAVGAHHIVPWHIRKDDHPGNGLALCKICGWTFENGLFGIGEKDEVIIPTAGRLHGNLPAHLLIFKGRVITKPKEKSFRPNQENLAWHRKNVLRD